MTLQVCGSGWLAGDNTVACGFNKPMKLRSLAYLLFILNAEGLRALYTRSVSSGYVVMSGTCAPSTAQLIEGNFGKTRPGTD